MTASPFPIALVGLRAVGKSTVAVLLARQLGFEACDTDAEIVRLAVQRGLVDAGSDTGDVFRAVGEDSFRDLEGEVLADAVGRPQMVIATGGGAVERDAARALLRNQALSVWLDAPIELLARRMRADPDSRPALFGADPIAELPQLAARRAPLFAEVARVRVKVGNLDPSDAARAVAAALEPFLPTTGR